MNIPGGVRGGRGPVPNAQSADNRKIEKDVNISSVIKSARWGRSFAGLSDNVTVNVELNKQSTRGNATVEIFFYSAGKPHPFDTPFALTVNGLTATGSWQTKAPRMKNWTTGHFVFRVWVDGEHKMSDVLKLTDDPVARVVQRNNSDGFDR